MEYIGKRKEQDGLTHREASNAWMLSSTRATLLEGLSEKELKRRRFV